MRKFILYTLLILLLLATVTLAYGFYNAKIVRNFAKNVQAIEKENDFDGELQEVQNYFLSSGEKDSKTITSDTKNYPEQLDGITNKTTQADKAIESLHAPQTTISIRNDFKNYFKKTGQQAQDLKALVIFTNQITGISSFLSEKWGDNIDLELIKNTISDAQNMSENTSAQSLPSGVRADGEQLIASINDLLSTMNRAVSEKSTDMQPIEQSYTVFSQSADKFFQSEAKYISEMENLNPLKNKINSELPALGGVYFSLR